MTAHISLKMPRIKQIKKCIFCDQEEGKWSHLIECEQRNQQLKEKE